VAFADRRASGLGAGTVFRRRRHNRRPGCWHSHSAGTYADQNERDYAVFQGAVEAGRAEATIEIWYGSIP
jgi:hypothetical protein